MILAGLVLRATSSTLAPRLAAMGGQKRINAFFSPGGAKRPKSDGIAAADKADQPGGTEAAPETVEARSEGAAAPGAQQQSPPASGTAPPPTPEALHAAQLAELQALRAHANRNCALVKQAVLRSERTGSVLPLADLLVEESWREMLSDELGSAYFAGLQSFVQAEWRAALVFPPKHAVFRAFNGCPVGRVRVVILGQDPYHGLGQAMGLSFSVPQGKPIPSSLRNMYKELRDDVGCPPAAHGCLEKWAHQGVLLLNAVLTVRSGQPASHAKQGWERFTEQAVARLSKERSGIVFLLWGRYAQDKGRVIDASKHHVLTAAHPSGLSASRGFFGCKAFSRTNELLVAQGQLPIDWCLD